MVFCCMVCIGLAVQVRHREIRHGGQRSALVGSSMVSQSWRGLVRLGEPVCGAAVGVR